MIRINHHHLFNSVITTSPNTLEDVRETQNGKKDISTRGSKEENRFVVHRLSHN
jgi:hypothetical protein